jgi:single-strand DNA-binding protein
MSSYNKVIMVGRLTKDPESTVTSGGKTVAKFTIAVDRRGKKDEVPCDFFFCVAWEKTAELICKHLNKGSQCLIDGRLAARQYETADKQKRTVTEIVVDNVQFLGAKKEAVAPAEDEGTPF